MRMWRPKLIGSNDQFGGLQCILVDQKTDAIQASVKEIDYDFAAPKIKADVFGHITGIQPLEQKMVGNERLEDKCEVCIENIRTLPFYAEQLLRVLTHVTVQSELGD
ncbi:hypothetical protein Prudu_891S000100 [Prunus dulcis]|uniref:Uncharacterized protein n=1 Tax=Prunus dulcis TaxID=3755 RepID=A0A5H2Y4W1_PRUDU|nr:hypothetical protein Prudu_891S000100 [Prunus dulcis]